ncbi:hypothetical protein [Listeria monocytogenes]|uniref:hypothetical protein n=1 Tax=Listeria monocytogenes TaxID=1639 RepID=UPI00190BDBDF|nr:hypothetical protein [Listeria monocytogenes]MBK3698534.1 hypothetical protein [Listeria monocytogenes]
MGYIDNEGIIYLGRYREDEIYFSKCHVCGNWIFDREAIAYEFKGQAEVVHESCYFEEGIKLRRENK